MKDKIVAVIGEAGFVGRSIVRELSKRDARIVVGCRDVEAGKFLRSMGDVGQINLVKVDVANYDQMARLMDGVDYIISLVGILNETGKNTFEATQSTGPMILGKLARKLGLSAVVHLSAIGANITSKSRYASSKALGEQLVSTEFEHTTILRPSIIFGPDDKFFNRFANLAAVSPILPLIGGGRTLFQPVYVQDIAKAAIMALERDDTKGKLFELGGPSIYSFEELLRLLIQYTGQYRRFVNIPFPVASAQARFLELLPKAPLTRDQVELLKVDNIVSRDALTFQDLGISPVSCELVLPTYLDRFRRGGRYNKSKTGPKLQINPEKQSQT